MSLSKTLQAVTLAAAATLATAGTASALKIAPDEKEIYTADACIDKGMAVKAHNIAVTGGGVINMDSKALARLFDDCTRLTGTKVSNYYGMTHVKLAIPAAKL